MVFLLAINRSNTSHSQLDSRRADGGDTRRTVSQQAQLHLSLSYIAAVLFLETSSSMF